MNKEKFINCLRDPSLLQDNDIKELNLLVRRYPYFQGARILLAKVAKERNLKNTARYISSAAVYATDRALLKKYISDHLFFLDSREAAKEEKPKPSKTLRPPVGSDQAVKQAPQKTGKPKPPPAPRPQGNEIKPTKSASKKRTAPKGTQTPKKAVPQKPTPPAEEKLTDLQISLTDIDEWIKEIYEDIEALKKSKARFKELDKKLEEEEKQKKAEKEEEDAVNAALKKVARSKKPAAKTKTDEAESEEKPVKTRPARKTTAKTTKKEEAPAKKAPAARKKAEATKEVKPKAPRKKSPPKEKITADSTAEEKVVTEPTVEEKEAAEPKVEVKKPVTKKPSAKKKATKAESEKKATKTEGEKDAPLKVVRRRSGMVKSTTFESKDQEKSAEDNKDKIIDEFINTSPKISKADKSKITSAEDKEDLSDKSSRFQADIGTEYLAEIYVEQGKIDRALSIYEKLSLKFPEKKAYFVARIEELKSK